MNFNNVRKKETYVDPSIFYGYGWFDDCESVTEILCTILGRCIENWAETNGEFKLFKKVCRKFKIKGLEFYQNDDNYCIIGRSFISMKGDETRADLIRDVSSKLFVLGGECELPVNLIGYQEFYIK